MIHDIKSVTEALEKLRHELEQEATKMRDLEMQIQNAHQEAEAAKSEMRTDDVEIHKKETEIAALRQAISTARQAAAKKENEIAKLNDQHRILQREEDNNKRALSEFERERQNAEREAAMTRSRQDPRPDIRKRP